MLYIRLFVLCVLFNGCSALCRSYACYYLSNKIKCDHFVRRHKGPQADRASERERDRDREGVKATHQEIEMMGNKEPDLREASQWN